MTTDNKFAWLKYWKVIGTVVLMLSGVLGWKFGIFDFIPKISTPLGDFVGNSNAAAVNTTGIATTL